MNVYDVPKWKPRKREPTPFSKRFDMHNRDNLSLRFIAREMGVGHSALSRWMSGNRQISFESLNQLCDIVSVYGQDRRELFMLAGYTIDDRFD